MIKYFYLVEFKYLDENLESSFDLGVFSTKKKAEEKIEKSINLNGFKEHNINNFKIIKFGVNFDNNIKDKSNVILYCVTHEYEDETNEFTYCWNIFDYFSTMEKANSKVEYLKKHSRIGKKYPNNFDVVEVKINNFNLWSKGFDKLNK